MFRYKLLIQTIYLYLNMCIFCIFKFYLFAVKTCYKGLCRDVCSLLWIRVMQVPCRCLSLSPHRISTGQTRASSAVLGWGRIQTRSLPVSLQGAPLKADLARTTRSHIICTITTTHTLLMVRRQFVVLFHLISC